MNLIFQRIPVLMMLIVHNIRFSKGGHNRWTTTGGIDRPRYLKIRDDAGQALFKMYVPEYDDAVEAGELLRDFGTLWRASSVARRNGMAKAILEAVYVNPEEKNVVGLLAKKPFLDLVFLDLVLAMAERTDLKLVESWSNCSGRNGGDGGESNSPSRRAYKPDMLQACPTV